MSQKKKPIYVAIYDKLYDMLTDGTFQVGEALPSEPKLASMLGVSRTTLRQALELLDEDGLVEKVRGKGNFVLDRNKPIVSSMEKLGNPIYKCMRIPIDPKVEMDFRLEPSSKYDKTLFKRPTAVTVAIDRWYRSEGELVAYTLTLAPIETITSLELDLKDEGKLLTMLEETVYTLASRSHLKVKTTKVGSFISEKHVLTEKGELMLVYENLYTDDDYAPILHNKHYMLPKSCSIEINAIGER